MFCSVSLDVSFFVLGRAARLMYKRTEMSLHSAEKLLVRKKSLEVKSLSSRTEKKVLIELNFMGGKKS